MAELKTILCVDDEPDVLAVAEMCLETVGGYTVVTATSGAEAIAKASAVVPDAILLDVMMPDMDGPKVLQALRTQVALDAVPVIFMTARVRPSEIEEYKALGGDGVVPKPFDPMQLSAQVSSIWEAFHAR